MRDPQQSYPSSDSDAFLVVRISNRVALLLCLGLIALAGALVLRPAKTAAPATDELVTSEVRDPTPPSASEEKPRAPDPVSIPEARPTPQATRAVSARDVSAPLPVRTLTRRTATDYPYTPTASTAPSDSAASDNTPAEQPADPTPSFAPASTLDPPPPPHDAAISPVIITAAGSSSPYPLYSKWFDSFNKLHPDVVFSYQSVGSKAGLKQLLDGIVNFGAVDAPLTDEQLASAKTPILHVPTVIGAVVPVYSLPEAPDLRFTPRILAGIFSGKITRWNDPQITANNPTAVLSPWPITVIHRSDGCSSTQLFTNYLSKVSSEWQHAVGEGTSVNWPVGLGAKGNEGVYGVLKQSYGAIAVVDFQYAILNHIDFASVQNRSGRFVKADVYSLTAAAASSHIPDDFRVWITNSPGHDAYPISSFTWFVAPLPHDPGTRDIAAFLQWITQSGPQATAARMSFAPLPRELADRLSETISRIH
jgi:phosphate transport system substrate-binding protein